MTKSKPWKPAPTTTSPKPFGPDGLLARLRALFRRTPAHKAPEPIITTDNFTIDLAKHRVTRVGADVSTKLTGSEIRDR